MNPDCTGRGGDVCLHPKELALLGVALAHVASEAEAFVILQSSPSLYSALKTENEKSQQAATWRRPTRGGTGRREQQVSTSEKEVNRTP